MAELKPCPFCGWKPEVSTYYEGDKKWYEIECVNSGECEHLPSICGHPSEADAIEAWNRRAQPNTAEDRHAIALAVINEYARDYAYTDPVGDFANWCDTRRALPEQPQGVATCTQPDTEITCADRSNQCLALCSDCPYKQ